MVLLVVAVDMFLADAIVANRDDLFSAIYTAPERYQPMFETFRTGDVDSRGFLKYCKLRLVVTDYWMIRESDPEPKPDTFTFKGEAWPVKFACKTNTIDRDSLRRADRNKFKKFAYDVNQGLQGLSSDDEWLPQAGDLDFMKKDLGYGYTVRACAGCYLRILIDPKDDKHPIKGWTYTIR